jgi:hypothetical protein
MKRIINIAAASLILMASVQLVNAQTKDKEKEGVGQEIKHAGKATGKAVAKGAKAVGKGAKAVGKKTAEVSSRGYAEVKDKSLKNMHGPNGETVYVNKYNQKYYVDKKGRWIYLDQ